MAQGRVLVGEWIVGDTLVPYRVNVKNVDKSVADLTGVTAATLELRSRDGQASFSLSGTISSPATLGYVDFFPGSASWTAPAGRIRELFECWLKIVKPAGTGYAMFSVVLQLRTAP